MNCENYISVSFKVFVFFVWSLISIDGFSQLERSLLREGNKEYDKEDYEKAIQLYQESKAVNGSYEKAAFNLGNALYRTGNLGQASKEYEMSAAGAFEKEEKANAFHNVGNSFLNAARMLMKAPPQESDSVQAPDPQQLIKASIEAYKKALRNNPQDEETRYNLAYAKKLLKEGGGGGGQDQQDQEQDQQDQEQDQQDQEQDQQDQGDNGDQEQEQDQQNQGDKGDQDKEDQGQKEQPNNEMTKEEAEQLLEALDKNEDELQEKLGKERVKGERTKTEKDW